MQTAIRRIIAAERRRGAPFQASLPVAKLRVIALILLSCAAPVLGTGCISAPPRKITAVEKAREESAVGVELARQFEQRLNYESAPVVIRYLNNLTRIMTSRTQDARLTAASVVLIRDRGGLWRSYGLPGRRIYLSVGLLKQLHFDNEVAAAVALELGDMIRSHALKHLKQQERLQERKRRRELKSRVKRGLGFRVDFFSPEGIFAFDVEEEKASIRSAVKLLYGGGFDVRGIMRIWEVMRSNPAHSPYPIRVLDELEQYTRATISSYPPIRNPIVKTEEFSSIHKRIMKL